MSNETVQQMDELLDEMISRTRRELDRFASGGAQEGRTPYVRKWKIDDPEVHSFSDMMIELQLLAGVLVLPDTPMIELIAEWERKTVRARVFLNLLVALKAGFRHEMTVNERAVAARGLSRFRAARVVEGEPVDPNTLPALDEIARQLGVWMRANGALEFHAAIQDGELTFGLPFPAPPHR